MSNELKAQNQVLTLTLNGDITLDVFAEGVRHFQALAAGLASEIAPGEKVDWALETLESGSAIMGIRPVMERLDLVPAIVIAYATIGTCLQQDRPLPYGEGISRPARELVKLLDKGVPSVVFQTNDEDIPVSSPYAPQSGVVNKPKLSIGTLKGRIDSLGRRRGVRFTLYDALFDRPIPCYLGEGREDMVRDFWGRKVLVTGRISRDGQTGKPYAIRAITNIETAPVSEPGSWRKAAGVLNLGGRGPEFLQQQAQ